MSRHNEAFVCVLNRCGKPLPTDLLDRMATTLSVYGSAVQTVCEGSFGLVVRQARATDSIERFGTGEYVAVAGDLNLPDEPEPGLKGSLDGSDGPGLSGIAEIFQAEGRAFLAKCTGAFVFISTDLRRGRLSISRDHLGQQKVYYYCDQNWCIAASEPEAILAHGVVSGEMDECSIRRYLAFDFSFSERSFYQNIQELAPGCSLEVSSRSHGTESYWQFSLIDCGKSTDPEYQEERFRHLLQNSIERDALGFEAEEIGLSLSGGLDSTAIAAISAHKPRLFSWKFSDARASTEIENIRSVSQHFDAPVQWVDGDGAEPLCEGFAEQFTHVNSPYCNAFSQLRARLYEGAGGEGCRLMMVGDSGDLAFSTHAYWLRDMLADGRLTAFMRFSTQCALRAMKGDRWARISLRNLIPKLRVLQNSSTAKKPWLTSEVARTPHSYEYTPILRTCLEGARLDLAVGTRSSEHFSEENRFFARCGMGRSDAFRDWRLLQFTLALPAYKCVNKQIVRDALTGLLPERVLKSGRVGSLGWFFLKGIDSNRRFIDKILFDQPVSDWQKFVEKDWVKEAVTQTNQIGFEHTITWRVLCYELWVRKIAGVL